MSEENSIQYTHVNGFRMAYRDQGQGEAIVFVHGTPSSTREFAPLMTQLSKEFRTIAADHIGFGNSERPTNWSYTVSDHQKNFEAFVDSLKIDSFHLLVHDFGGGISLPYALKHRNKIKSLTIMNSWFWPLEDTETSLKTMKFLMTSLLMKWSYLHLNFSPRIIVKSAWGTHHPLSKSRHQEFMDDFSNPTQRIACWRLAESVCNPQDPAWGLSAQLHQLESLPILVVWGNSDKFVTINTLKKWKEYFPNAQVHQLDKVGHFVAEEGCDLAFPILKKFLKNVTRV